MTATDTESGQGLIDYVNATASPDGSVIVEETVSAVDRETGAAEVLLDATKMIYPGRDPAGGSSVWSLAVRCQTSDPVVFSSVVG